jgi:hypothetical protein
MNWLIIVAVFALVVAPLFAILPNARQRQLARMRVAARAAGINVSITTIEDPDPDPERYISASGHQLERRIPITGWQRPRSRPNDWRKREHPAWSFARVSGAAEEGLPAGWVELSLMAGEDLAALRARVIEALPGLPDDVVQVGEHMFVVSVYWHERNEESFDTVVRFLQDAAGAMVFRPSVEGDEARY